MPGAMRRLDPWASYRFCPSGGCPVVYFGGGGQSFTTDDVTVPVFQKDNGPEVLACYCFGFSRQDLLREPKTTGRSTALEAIAAWVRERKCACELRNPQGSCCLGNVRRLADEVG